MNIKNMFSKISDQFFKKPALETSLKTVEMIHKSFEDLNEEITFFTDAATLAIFDPQVLQHRVNDECTWWCDKEFHQYPEVAQGLISLVSLSNDGIYKIRFTSSLELTELERDYAVKLIEPLGISVLSGYVFIGRGELLPGNGEPSTKNSIHEGDGQFIHLQSGEYDLSIYAIGRSNIANSSEENREICEILPDIVIQIKRRVTPFIGLAPELSIFNDYPEKYLFPSKKRKERARVKPGFILKAKIWKSPNAPSGLALKDDEFTWPKGYDVQLDDMSLVKWRDRVVLRVTEINEAEKIIMTKLVSREQPKS